MVEGYRPGFKDEYGGRRSVSFVGKQFKAIEGRSIDGLLQIQDATGAGNEFVLIEIHVFKFIYLDETKAMFGRLE